MIATVGDLIEQLQRHPTDAKLRVMVRVGDLYGIERVENIVGRVTIVPKHLEPRRVLRRRR